MPHKSDTDWIAMCPENFRDEIKDIFTHPPGSPEGARSFCYAEDDGYDDTYLDDLGDPNDAVAKEQRKKILERKQFAKAWGKYAEAITARYIIGKGLPLREWNWKPGKGKGEIDLITQKGKRIIFIEVKARSGKHSDPWEAITSAKIKDLCHGADIYLKMMREEYEYQFDIALLTGKYNDYQFEYIEDAFLCPLRTSRG